MVRALLQSSDGQVWIATLDGLTQFDGERFRAFTKAQGVPGATSLAEDRHGNVWIGTAAGGALRLARNGFTSYTEADGLAGAPIRECCKAPRENFTPSASTSISIGSTARGLPRFG